MAANVVEEYELPDPPSDGISSVVFAAGAANLLLVSSWDKVGCDVAVQYRLLLPAPDRPPPPGAVVRTGTPDGPPVRRRRESAAVAAAARRRAGPRLLLHRRWRRNGRQRRPRQRRAPVRRERCCCCCSPSPSPSLHPSSSLSYPLLIFPLAHALAIETHVRPAHGESPPVDCAATRDANAATTSRLARASWSAPTLRLFAPLSFTAIPA